MMNFTAGMKKPGAPVNNGTVDKKNKPTFYEIMDCHLWADHKEIVMSTDEMLNLAHYQKW